MRFDHASNDGPILRIGKAKPATPTSVLALHWESRMLKAV